MLAFLQLYWHTSMAHCAEAAHDVRHVLVLRKDAKKLSVGLRGEDALLREHMLTRLDPMLLLISYNSYVGHMTN